MIGAKANTPEAANNLLKVLRVVLAHGVDVGMIASNPALGVKRYRNRSEGNHSWSEIEIAQFQATHAIDTRAGLALALLLYTGQRRSDVVRMGWQHVKGNRIMVRQQKTGRPLKIPMHPNLVARAGRCTEEQHDVPRDRARRIFQRRRVRQLVPARV